VTEPLTPRTNTKLFGHEETEAMLLRDLASGKLAHGLIFSGVRGIGKATLAYRFARALLSDRNSMEMSENNPIFHRVAANSHTDLLVIEPLYDAKKDEYANEITIEQSRTIAQMLSLTPAEGQWRVVIIDSIDALNTKSANAILKILEEPPPQTILMLIAHNVGGLLPTIRSRCRIITMKPLGKEDFSSAIRHVAPEIYGDELSALGVISANSVGIALELRAQGALILYNEVVELMASAKNIDNQRLLRFCEQIGSGKKAHGNWQLVSHITLCVLERITKQSSGITIKPINEEEGIALSELAGLHNSSVWAAKWQEAANQFLLAQRLHLDYKQVALTFFHSLASAEEFNLGNTAA
jgi:DNA polymerase-3 subunit delta'